MNHKIVGTVICLLSILEVCRAESELVIATGPCSTRTLSIAVTRQGDGYLLIATGLTITDAVSTWYEEGIDLGNSPIVLVEPANCAGTRYILEVECYTDNSEFILPGYAQVDVVLYPVPLNELEGANKDDYDIITSYIGDEGDSVTLKCQDESLPPFTDYPFKPIFKWAKAAKYTGGKAGVVLDPEVTTNELVLENVGCDDAGYYNCKIRRCPQDSLETFACNGVNIVVQLPPPQTPPTSKCNVYGDPHIQTFDGKHYSYSGRCVYILAMDGVRYRWFIYGKFGKCGDGGSSCLESIYVIARTSDYPEGASLELLRGFTLNVQGEKKVIAVDQTIDVKGIGVTYTGKKIVVDIAEYGVVVSWDGLSIAEIEVGQGILTRGLCGDNDGDKDNDFSSYFDEVERDDASEFGNLWVVGNAGGCEFEEDEESPAPLTVDSLYESFKKLPTLPSTYTKTYCSKFLDNSSALSFLAKSLDKESRDAYIESCQADLKGNLDHFYSLPTFIRCNSHQALANEAKRQNMCIDRWDITLLCPDPQNRREEAVRIGCVWTQEQQNIILEIP